jgi:tRNA(Met) cytidine acetyltransferase
MSSLLEQLAHSRQRQLVVLQGPQDWCDARCCALASLGLPLQLLSNRELLPQAVPFSRADNRLGSESRLVVMDLFDGFNPDVLCIAAGLVVAGGALVLLSPAAGDWDTHADRYARWQDDKCSERAWFVEYFFNRLGDDPEIGIWLTPGALPESPAPLPRLQPTPINDGETEEQARVLHQLLQWAVAGKPGVALIEADRGRGKSSCLGLLVKRLQPRLGVLVTANSRQSASALLQQAPDAEFVAPDQLLLDCPEADLLIVDEAAMIPLSMLRQLTRLYPRLVMATTSGGYEGTGRGFMLRFVADLQRFKLLHDRLEKPVRWCQGDGLEAWLNRCLMLKPDSEPVVATDYPVDDCRLEVLEHPGSAAAWPLLRQAYALLNAAHYRTRPSDLRLLMENPDLVLIVARLESSVLGVALLNLEGGLDESLSSEIFYGRRRPRGHLLAQMLTAQAGLRHFACYRGMRVQRIAVLATHRRQGLGSRLIERAMQYGRDNSLDYLGASFALDPDNARFWQQAHCRLVHVSYAPGKSSGDHSIAVLRPIAEAPETDIRQLRQRLQQQLPTWLTQFLQSMESEQVTALLRYADYEAGVDELEQNEIEAFTAGNKGFEICFASLQKYVMQCIARSSIEPDRLLVEKAVQNRDWKLLERESGSEGRRQLQQRLRGLVAALRKAC